MSWTEIHSIQLRVWYLAGLLQTALLFKWENFGLKSHEISWYIWHLRISSILIGLKWETMWYDNKGLGTTWGCHRDDIRHDMEMTLEMEIWDGIETTWEWYWRQYDHNMRTASGMTQGWHRNNIRDDINDSIKHKAYRFLLTVEWACNSSFYRTNYIKEI